MIKRNEPAATQYVSVDDFRKRHDLGRTPAYEALRRGDIPHVRIGRKILIPEDALDIMLRLSLIHI